MIETIIKWALVVALIFGVLYGIVLGYEHWRDSVLDQGDVRGAGRVQQLWDKDVERHDAIAAKAVADGRKQEREQAAQAMETEREARRNAEKLAILAQASAARSAAAAGGLSGHIAALDAAARGGGLPEAAACPGQLVVQRDAAIAARALLGSCTAEYQRLGQDADDAVDAITLKLETALGYIAIVGPRPP
jgi:hypothetical protein